MWVYRQAQDRGKGAAATAAAGIAGCAGFARGVEGRVGSCGAGCADAGTSAEGGLTDNDDGLTTAPRGGDATSNIDRRFGLSPLSPLGSGEAGDGGGAPGEAELCPESFDSCPASV